MTARDAFGSTGMLFVLTLVACGGAQGGRDDNTSAASGKADELDDATAGEPDDIAHRDAVITCSELAQRRLDRTHEDRVDELVVVERDRQNCLSDANDDVVDVIDNALQNVESSAAGETEMHFTAMRDAAQDLCNVLVEGSEAALATDKSAAVLSQRCTADAEKNLADLVDGYVALGVDAITIPEARVTFDACYDAFDEASQSSIGHADDIAALEALAACMVEEHDALRAVLVQRIVENFPGREPADLEDETYRYFRLARDAGEETCGSLSLAGEATDEAFVETQKATCLVASHSQIGELAVAVVPALGGAESSEDSGGSDGGSGSTGGV